MDCQIFETIQRLAQAGIITLKVPTEILHTSSQFSETKNRVQEKQINQAKKHLELALRKQQMAQILTDGDFYEEAFVILRESLDFTIKAFAWLNGKSVTKNYIT